MIGALLGRSEEESGEGAYEQEQTAQLAAGRTPRVVTLPFRSARVGEYLMRTRIEAPDGQLLAQVEKRFSVRWTGLVAHVRNLDEAVAQLRYIGERARTHPGGAFRG